MAVVNQRLWISSAGVLEHFQNIPSSSLPETDSQVDLAATLNASHRGLRPFCLLQHPLAFSNPLSRRPSLFSFLTNSHLQLSLFPCHLPITSSLHFLLFFLIISRRSFSTASSRAQARCYGAVLNSGLELSVIRMCVVVWNLRHQFQACLELRVGTIDFLLKSYYSHFSWYSCFPHIQAICQVTMTGAGTCKQDICIQEIALLQRAFPQAVTMREPKYGYVSAEGGNWKIACANNNTVHAGTSATTHKHIHIKQEVAPRRALNIRTLK